MLVAWSLISGTTYRVRAVLTPASKFVYCPSRQHNFDVILSKDSFLTLLSNSSVFLAISNKQDATGSSGRSPGQRDLRREDQQGV
jgi:hypothetical protein